MATPLHVLLVEDEEEEAQLLLHALRRGGYEPRWERVETAAALAGALSRAHWDLVLCDYVMPELSAPAALRVIEECGLDVPVIIVSGQMGEEYAVEAMRAGAQDYVNKNNLARLVPAIERELQERRVRLARRRAEQEKVTLLEVAFDVAGTLALDDILDRVQRRTAAALPCDGMATFYWDPVRATYRVAHHLGVPEPVRPQFEALEFGPGHRMVEWLRKGHTVVINDMKGQEWLPPELATQFEFSALAAVPLMVRSWMLGVLVATRDEPRAGFETHEIQLLEGIARQLALGINAVELYRSQEQEARVSSALARVGRELMLSLSEPGLLGRLCQLTAEVLHCEASHTLLLDTAQQSWSVVAGYGDAPETWEAMRILRLPSPMVANMVAALERHDVVQLVFTEPSTLFPTEIGLGYGFRGGMYAALRRGERLFGVQTAEYRSARERFSPHDERILGGIAWLASVALDHVRVLDELERANRLKSDFVATMSHELRTPLNVIMGYSELLLEGEFGKLSEEQDDIMQRVNRSAGELLELINATLDVSRLDTGKLNVNGQEVLIQDLLPEIDVETLELQQRKPGVRFIWQVPPQLGPLYTDRTKLKVILKNLIGNAVKFTDDGTVSISAGACDGGVEVVVGDTGIGIAPHARSLIFEPFRQVDSSLTRRYGGVGLGLYIARRLAELLGGRIEVDSEVGKGSTFRVWLPGNWTQAQTVEGPTR